jgi:hypothetical protein
MNRTLLLLSLLAIGVPGPAVAQQNPLIPQLHRVDPAEQAKPAPKEEQAKPKSVPQQGSQADNPGLPLIAVHASGVEITTKDNATYVFFDLGWSIDATEPVAEAEGDLLLSDDDGHVHGRVPWTLKDPNGLPPRYDERGVGFDVSKSGDAQAWFKGAQPSWIHFGYLVRRVLFVSGRTVECKKCE